MRISEIKIKGEQGTLLKSYNLIHQAIESSGSTPSTDPYSKKRMYLDEVEEHAADGALVNEYKFGYLNRNSLPPRLSYQQDHWGYYNNNPVDQMIDVGLITEGKVQEYFPSFQSADRTTASDRAAYGLLNQVTYPTGGTVSYSYEGNEIVHCGDVEEEVPMSISATADYQTGPVTTTETFTIDREQTVQVSFQLFRIGIMSTGAYVELRRVDDNQVILLQKNECNGSTLITQPVAMVSKILRLFPEHIKLLRTLKYMTPMSMNPAARQVRIKNMLTSVCFTLGLLQHMLKTYQSEE